MSKKPPEKLVEGDAKWVSICSAHCSATPGCKRCKAGYWTSAHDLQRENDEFEKDPVAWRKKMSQ